MSHLIQDNTEKLRFEIQQNDDIAYMEYRFYKESIAFMHTVVPKAMENKGIGSALVIYAFQYAKSLNKRVMVYCPFVRSYIKKHPEYNSQLDTDFHKSSFET
jgi:predicted GNAT family acetyltransferase